MTRRPAGPRSPEFRRSEFRLAALCVAAGCAAPVQDGGTYQEFAPPAYGVIPRDRPYAPLGWDNGWDERGLLVLGRREFRAGALPEGDRQFAIGVELVGAPRGSWLELEIGFWGSARGGFGGNWLDAVFGNPQPDEISPGVFQDEASTSSLELSLGARKEVGLLGGAFRPYVGAGLSGLQVRTFELTSGFFADEVDGDVGVYGHFGFRFLFDGGGSVGFDLRAVEGTELDLGPGGSTIDGDYTQWAFAFSFFI